MYRDHILPVVRQQRLLHDVSLELTYACNLDCFYCYNDREKPGRPLSLDQYRGLLHDLAQMQTLFLMLTGGEPMLHPHFFEIGGMAKDLGFVTRVRTNGHSLGRRNAERLQEEVEPYVVEISLHGATAAVHDRQTRVAGSFDRLLKNVGNVTAAGMRCSMVCTPTAWNEHELDQMLALCLELGVPLRLQGPVAPRDNGDLAPLIIQPSGAAWEKAERIAQAQCSQSESVTTTPFAGEARAPVKEESASCSVGVAGVDIDPYGNVQACMHLQRSAGNLHQKSIKDIWNGSPLFMEAREKAIAAATQFGDQQPHQLGAPVFCLAVEENCNKACDGPATRPTAINKPQLIRAVNLPR